jgi:hypothetical protein
MKKFYTGGQYKKNNPTWHAEDSRWKSGLIGKMITSNHLDPKSICEVGCGAGEILNCLQKQFRDVESFQGYEISSDAYKLCKKIKNKKIKFFLRDFTLIKTQVFDILLIIDVLEHVDDYQKFLKKIKPKSKYKIFHIPLDISVKNVLFPKSLLRLYNDVGHIHFFSYEIIIKILEDQGYQIIDTKFTYKKSPRKFAFIRNFLASINSPLGAKLFGDCSILILAK